MRLKGLLLRVQPSGVMTWYAEFARGKRISLGRVDAIKPAEVRDEAKKVLSEAYAGRDPMAKRRAERVESFRSFIDTIYAPWAEEHIRTHKGTLGRLRGRFPELHKQKFKDITPLLVEKWRLRRLKEGAKPSTVNRDLNDLKSCLHKAVSWGISRRPLSNWSAACESMPCQLCVSSVTTKSVVYASHSISVESAFARSVEMRMLSVNAEGTSFCPTSTKRPLWIISNRW